MQKDIKIEEEAVVSDSELSNSDSGDITRKENTNNGKFECGLCGKSYKGKHNLTAHTQSHFSDFFRILKSNRWTF